MNRVIVSFLISLVLLISCSSTLRDKEMKSKLDSFIGSKIDIAYLIFDHNYSSSFRSKDYEYVDFKVSLSTFLDSKKCFESSLSERFCIDPNKYSHITFKVNSYGIIVDWSTSGSE